MWKPGHQVLDVRALHTPVVSCLDDLGKILQNGNRHFTIAEIMHFAEEIDPSELCELM